MKTYMEILEEVGGQHIAKGVEKGLLILDKQMGLEGAELWRKPSFWGKVILGLACIYASTKASPPYDSVLLAKGVHYTTALWDDLEAFFSK